MRSEGSSTAPRETWTDEAHVAAQQQETNRNVKQDSRFTCNICFEPVSEPVVTQCGHLYCWPCLYRWLEPGIRPEEAFWDNSTANMAERPVNESRRCCPVCKSPCSVQSLVPIYVRNEPSTPVMNRSGVQEAEEGGGQRTIAAHDDSEPQSLSSVEPDRAEQDTTPPPESEEQDIPSTTRSPPEQQLRQRLRFRSRDSEISFDDVPVRPAASSPSRNMAALHHTTAIAQRQVYRTPLSPTPQNRASLSHGLLLLFQQALNANTNVGGRDGVPPLHRRHDGVTARPGQRGQTERPHDDSTEFLSRLLLILGCFVILCLLIF